MAPKPRAHKGSITGKDASKAMPPPPDPPQPDTILGPETSGLSTCLKNAAVKTGQIYGFYTDTRKLGIEKHAPNPPRSLTAFLGREVEKYDQLCDCIESHLLRAISVLQRDLRREQQRRREAEQASVASRTRSKSTSASPTSIRIPLPATDAPQSSLPFPTPTNSPPAPSSTVGPGRRPSAISISSLHRPAFPLKLDLSSTALRISAEEASMFSSGLASPVTLAPKSARAVGPNEYPPELMAVFASSGTVLDQDVGIGLTISAPDEHNHNDAKLSMDANVGSTADKPIELDLEAMDIDMTNLFGDSGEPNSVDTNAGLFSPVMAESDAASTIKSEDKTERSFLDALGQPHNEEEDIFTSLGAQGGSNQPQQSQVPSSIPQSAPSPATLLASFSASSSQLHAESSSSHDINAPGSDAQFDLNTLDLSSLSTGFFGDPPDADMSFPMDINAFLNLGSVSDGKEETQGTRTIADTI